MQNSKRLALVDLGSNALRFEIVELEGNHSRSLYRHRAPIRLGSEVFAGGEISPGKIEAVALACMGFAEQCRLWGVVEIFGIATAAAREASNRKALVDRVAERSGIEIKVISGEQECRLLALAVGQVMDLNQGTNLLIDLGGGSIEASLITLGQVVSSQSHPLGTLRHVHDQRHRGAALLAEIEEQLQQRGATLRAQLAKTPVDRYIAVGGHMDALVSLLADAGRVNRRAKVATFSAVDLNSLAIEMAALDLGQLARRYRLQPDRADSILAAARAYHWIATLVDVAQVWAPGVSLRQGMVAALQSGTLG